MRRLSRFVFAVPLTLLGCSDDSPNGSRDRDAGFVPSNGGTPGTEVKDGVARYLDSPVTLRVDPNDSKHPYATQGVRGATLGFWVSHDGGETWEPVGPSFRDGYYQVLGDGNVLYAQVANTGQNSVGPQPYITSPETDGKTWTPYQDGTQLFTDGPATMAFDPINRILYSANWGAGFWALKVLN